MGNELKVSFIVATSLNGIIGNNNKIPWTCKEDMKRFKNITTGNVVIMGRKTFESLDKPLKNRINIVITASQKEEFIEIIVKDPGEEFSGATKLYKFNSLEKALEYVKKFKHFKKIFIIGGNTLYQQTLNICNDIYLTIIKEEIEGDTYFFKKDIINHIDSFKQNDICYTTDGTIIEYCFTNDDGFIAKFIVTNQFPSVEQLTQSVKSVTRFDPKCIFLHLQRVGYKG